MADRLLAELGEALRLARRRDRCSGAALASRAGVSQPTVSRVENGQRVSSVEAVERLILALPFPSEEAERLVSMARQAYALASAEKRVDAGVSLVPGAGRKLLASVSVVCGFQDAMVPALLRIPEYTAAAGGDGGAAAEWGKALADEGKDFRLVVTESALRTWPGSGAFMPAQLEHLLAVAERSNVWLGVIPWGVGLPVVPGHGFTLCGEAGVVVETFTAQMTLTGAEHVRPYRAAFEALEGVAVAGDGLVAVVDAVRRDLPSFIH